MAEQNNAALSAANQHSMTKPHQPANRSMSFMAMEHQVPPHLGMGLARSAAWKWHQRTWAQLDVAAGFVPACCVAVASAQHSGRDPQAFWAANRHGRMGPRR